jgi:hypothetical protein
MANLAKSSLVKSAEQFVKEHRSRLIEEINRPYRRDGAHVTVGRESPLAPDFVPSGSPAPARRTAK